MKLSTGKRLAVFFAFACGVGVIGIEALRAVPNEVRIPIVREHGRTDPPQAGLFSHWTHNEFSCYECHPNIFPQYRLGFTHDDLDAGRFCATCHNGKVAWHVDDADECEVCHVE